MLGNLFYHFLGDLLGHLLDICLYILCVLAGRPAQNVLVVLLGHLLGKLFGICLYILCVLMG